MLTKFFTRYAIISAALLLLTGCLTSQPDVQLTDAFWQNSQQKVVVATTKAPEPQLYQMGQQGLLDYAINKSVTSDFDKHLQRTDLNWYANLPKSFANQLKQRKIAAVPYDQPIMADQRSYSGLTGQSNSDKVLLIELNALGAKRNYYGFVPTGAPEAYVAITGQLIDPNTNQVLWRHKTDVTLPVKGTWDQPPNYTNFSQTLSVAINTAQQELLDSFFSGH